MAVDRKNLKAGDEVRSWCTKCREMREHKVKAITAGRPVRVICVSCDGEHNLREHPPGQGKNKSRGKKSKDKAETAKSLWEDLMKEINIEEARPYNIGDQFAPGDLIVHDKYGVGSVTEILDATKMEVLFQDRTRVMMFNMAS
jgi:hypothetical protein